MSLDSGKKPGGHSCFGVISKISPENGKVEILVMDCTEPSRHGETDLATKLELPGGTWEEGETPEATVIREVSAEVSEAGRHIKFRSVLPFHHNNLRGDGGGVHVQHFFCLEPEDFCLRRVRKTEENDGAVLGAPQWMDVNKFVRSIYTKSRHRIAVLILLTMLARKNKAVANMYIQLLCDYKVQVEREMRST